MVKPHTSSASRKSGQNSPAGPVPWWFKRREARRQLKVKGSNPPGLKVGRPSQATRTPAPSCEQPTVAKLSPWWFRQREERRAKRVAASLPSGVKEESRPTAGFRGVQKSVREVVRAVIRPLIAEFRSALKLFKTATREQKAVRPNFVRAKQVQRSEFVKKDVQKKRLAAPVTSELVQSRVLVSMPKTKPLAKVGGAFGFDYSAYALKEQARVEWRKLSIAINGIVASLGVHAPGDIPDAQIPVQPVIDAADKRVRNLLMMHVKDFGSDQLRLNSGELSILLEKFILPTNTPVMMTTHTGCWPTHKKVRSGPPLFTSTKEFMKLSEDP